MEHQKGKLRSVTEAAIHRKIIARLPTDLREFKMQAMQVDVENCGGLIQLDPM